MTKSGRSIFLSMLVVMAFPAETSALALPLRPGEDATFTLDIRNATNDWVPSASFDAIPIVSASDSYTLEVADSSSCEIRNGSLEYMVPIELHAGPLPPGSGIRCTLRVIRSAAYEWPTSIDFKPMQDTPGGISLSDPTLLLGPILDVSLHIDQATPFPLPGEREGIVRVSIRNSGPWNINKVNFGYCQDSGLAPFDLDNDLPGGCARADSGPVCAAVGAPSVQFGTAALASGETKSCLLRVTAHAPLTTPVRFGISIVDRFFPVDDQLLQDYDRSNNSAILELAPAIPNGNALPPIPVDTLGFRFKALLCLLIGAAAMARHSWLKQVKRA